MHIDGLGAEPILFLAPQGDTPGQFGKRWHMKKLRIVSLSTFMMRRDDGEGRRRCRIYWGVLSTWWEEPRRGRWPNEHPPPPQTVNFKRARREVPTRQSFPDFALGCSCVCVSVASCGLVHARFCGDYSRMKSACILDYRSDTLDVVVDHSWCFTDRTPCRSLFVTLLLHVID